MHLWALNVSAAAAVFFTLYDTEPLIFKGQQVAPWRLKYFGPHAIPNHSAARNIIMPFPPPSDLIKT